MKVFLLNLLIIALLGLAYYSRIFELFAMKYAFWIALVFVIGLLFAAFRLVGSPFAKPKDKPKKE